MTTENQAPEGAQEPEPAGWLVTWKGGEHWYCHAHASEMPAVDQARIMGGKCEPLYRAALAAPAPQAPTWQPIETAPKDGRKMLLTYANSNGNRRTVVGGWVTDEEAAETDADGVGLEAGWYERIDNWGEYYQVAIHEGEPDHWMPLPAAPQTKEPTNDR